MTVKLSKLIEEKSVKLQDISKRISPSESKRVQLELLIKDMQRSITREKESSDAKEKSVSGLILENQTLQSEVDLLTTELEKYSRRLTILTPAMEKLSSTLQTISEEPSSNKSLLTRTWHITR